MDVLPLSYPAVTVNQDQSPVVEGSPVTFTATPNGSWSDLAYTWQVNGAAVSGVTGATLTTTISSGSDLQNVSVQMSPPPATCPQSVALATYPFQVVSSDWENQNYIREQDILVPGISDWIGIDKLQIGQKRERTTYFDGLNRPIQKVDRSGSLVSGTSSDLVQPIAYDPAGRDVQQYMLYATNDNPGQFKSANVLSEQASFVTSKFGEPSGAPTYSQVVYDNSPLDRVVTSYAPGESWGGSNIGTSADYTYNDVSESVHIWNLAYSATAIPVTSPTAIYATGQLTKVTSTDENGKQVITYTDISGHDILKKIQAADPGSGLGSQHAGWACTYYVYNDLGQLEYTIPPKVVDYLDNNGWVLNQQLINDLCFVNTFDAKGRLISKKSPGIGETDIVYDQRDRPVFSQDANGLTNSQWQATLYDAMGRVTGTGVLESNISASALQTIVNGSTGNINIANTAGPRANVMVMGQQDGDIQYIATTSITLENFTSDPNGIFVAYINPNLGSSIPEAVATADNPIPQGSQFIQLTQTFYDDYSQGSKSYTTADNSLFDPSTNQKALTLPTQCDPQTRGRVTVSKVKVITNPGDLTQGNWLETDNYYDDQGRTVQVQNDNVRGGTDILTNRYDFSGKLWGACVRHMAGSPQSFTVVSKNCYDLLGRLTDLSKNFNSTFFKDLASYAYDEYGRLTTKTLAPGYTGSGNTYMEQQTYSYNIRGWLTGINKGYALDQNTYDQWNSFFGISLGYDNGDNQFDAHRYDGTLTGVIWKSQGDNSMRRYDYTYDDEGRLSSAVYQQRTTPADNWSNNTVDFSEYITYADLNGNIHSIQHMGVVPGMSAPLMIDNLIYTYGSVTDPNVNQVSRIDERANFNGNGQMDDFKDGSNQAGTNDYIYDASGNILQDQNKGVTDGGSGGIVYNYLNKPISITVAGKSLVQYVYDATGVKLKKTVTNLSVTPHTTTTTTYDGEFVYQDNNLQYVLHEEGRLNIITPVSTPQQQLNAGPNGANNVLPNQQGVFEYFIKDQLSNVRMVLSEQSEQESYIATMETSSAADPNLGTDEAKLFGQVDPATGDPTPDNEVNSTRTPTNQTPWSGNPSQEVSHLSAALANQTIGPNLFLKVSAGDLINAGVNYFYYTNSPAGPTYTGADVVSALLSTLAGSNLAPLAEGNSSLIGNTMNASGSDFVNFINTYVNGSTSPAPKAFLNVLFFDEQFNFIPNDPSAPGVGTWLSQVSSADDQNATPLALQQKAPKNGWVYIYISNESNQDVYFDNLSVSQVHGNISEENHYYAFGQKITGICTNAVNHLASHYHYQGDYSEEEENTGYNEFALRMFDRQTGRWTGADPFDQFSSPYIGMGNDPVNNTDPSGGDIGDDFESGDMGDLLQAFGPGDPHRVSMSVIMDWWSKVTYCDKCLVADIQPEVVVSSPPIPVLKIIWAESKQGVQFTAGFLYGAGKTALDVLKHNSMPLPTTYLLHLNDPNQPTNPFADLMNGLNSAANFGAMLTDPTGAKQKAYFSSLYYKYKYATPFDAGQMASKAAVTVTAVIATRNPEVAVEEEALETTAATTTETSTAEATATAPAADGAAATPSPPSTPSGSQYSVAFEMELPAGSYPGKGYGVHFRLANKALEQTMISDPKFAEMIDKLGIQIPRKPTGTILGESPANWVWHHDPAPGVMQLVPQGQHTAGSIFWNTLHPGGFGGMAIWGR